MSYKLFQHRSNNSKNSTAIELNEEGEESTLEQDEIMAYPRGRFYRVTFQHRRTVPPCYISANLRKPYMQNM